MSGSSPVAPTTGMLDRLERAAGLALGLDGEGTDLAGAADGLSVRDALEGELRAALRRTPCVVSFSGGRDSSALLALAVRVARHEGLPDPVPVTFRFPGNRWTDESDWQEMVIAYLEVKDWEVMSFGPEREVLGELATGVLRRHGPLWPPNLYLYLPLIERARGGSLINGWDGDVLFGGWPFARVQAVLNGRARPERGDLIRLVRAFAPTALRREIGVRRDPVAAQFPWLTPTAQHAATRRFTTPPPRRWDAWVAWYTRRRHQRVAARSLAILGHDHEVGVFHPLIAPPVLAGLARDGGATGLAMTRADIMRLLFGDLLPQALLERTTKADFAAALWSERCRAFATEWDGRGVDAELVDADRLRAAWLSAHPMFGSWTLAQAAWLANVRPQPAVRG